MVSVGKQYGLLKLNKALCKYYITQYVYKKPLNIDFRSILQVFSFMTCTMVRIVSYKPMYQIVYKEMTTATITERRW